MSFKTLISTDVLAAHLSDPAFVIVDCRYKLDDEAWGEREHGAKHIPGAVYAHLGHDLAGPRTGTNGRHPLPDPHTFAQTLGRLGVASGVQVVTYDQDQGMYASRLWWMLRWLGTMRPPCSTAGSPNGLRRDGRPWRRGASRGAPSPRRDPTVADVNRVSSSIKTGETIAGVARAGVLRRPNRSTGRGHPRRRESFLSIILDSAAFRSARICASGWNDRLGRAGRPPRLLLRIGVTACQTCSRSNTRSHRREALSGSWSE
jgi:hypothetical protein